MLIELITGSETFEIRSGLGGTVKIMAFYRRTPNAEEMAIQSAAKDRHSGVIQSGSDQWINASASNRNHGQWVTSRYQVPEMSYVKLMISRRETGDFIMHNKQVYLQCRQNAACRRLRIEFTVHPDATMQAGYVEGRFDILTLAQLKSLNFNIPGQFENNFKIDNLDDVFTQSILENELTPFIIPSVDIVQTDQGRQVRIARPTSRRKLNLP